MVDPTHADDYPYLGMYLPYVYLKLEQQNNPDNGPHTWAQQVADDGSLAKCVTQNAAQWLLGWSDEEIESALIDQWATTFEAENMNYKELIREIISHPAYRRRK